MYEGSVEVERNSKGFIGQIVLMFFLTSSTQIQILACQLLSSKISLDHLNAFSMLNYVWLFCQVIGFSLGETCYVLLSKDLRRHKIRQYLGGALSLYLLFALGFIVLSFCFSNAIISFLGIDKLPGVETNFAIWIAISVVYGIISIFFNIFVLSQSQASLFFLGPVGLVTNIALGAAAIYGSSTPEKQFLYLNLSCLVSWIILFSLVLFFMGKDVRLGYENMKIFTFRAFHMIAGDILLQTLILVVPMFFSLALQHSLGGESLAAYNVGFRILEIFIVLQWSIQFYGISWLTDIVDFWGEPEWFKCLRSIAKVSTLLVGLPLVAVTLLVPWLLPAFFNLHSKEAIIIAMGTIISFLPTILTTDLLCKLKVFEKHIVKAVVSTALIFGLGLPSVYFFNIDYLLIGIVGCGLLLPSTLEAIWIFVYNRIWMPDPEPKIFGRAPMG